tara:strand:+ start:139 stop:306 length:168 start_codon:yes stop_codon:yes gene_type:complete
MWFDEVLLDDIDSELPVPQVNSSSIVLWQKDIELVLMTGGSKKSMRVSSKEDLAY